MAAEQPCQWNQLLLSSFLLIIFCTHLGQPLPSLPWGRLLAHRQVPAWLLAHGPIRRSWWLWEANHRRLMLCSGLGDGENPGFRARHPRSSWIEEG